LWSATFYTAAIILIIMTLTIRESATSWRESGGWSYWVCIALCCVELVLTLLILVSYVSYDARR
jgi:hypothetical protein